MGSKEKSLLPIFLFLLIFIKKYDIIYIEKMKKGMIKNG